MFYAVKLNKDSSLRKYLLRRNYFLKEYYKFVTLKTENDFENEEIKKFLFNHCLEYKFEKDEVKYKVNNFSYELSVNFYLQDSNINRFKSHIIKITEKLSEKLEYCKIIFKDFTNFNGCVTEIRFSVVSEEKMENCKEYLDLYFKEKFNKSLKIYNEGRNIGIKKLKENGKNTIAKGRR